LSIRFENQSKLFSKRVYVSRKNAKYRHILNENEFQTAISHLNFSTYLLEEMSLSDQISLFKNAEIIIASHGAGLTNIVYCQSRTKIIEFFPENYYEECYQNISSLLDLDHYIVIEDNGDTNYNFAVNIISALNLLKRII
jgi:capsular polysaccharide biosynthesis protein